MKKKILLLMSMGFLMFFSGCSEMVTTGGEAHFEGQLVFSYSRLGFGTLHPNDILKYIQDDYADLPAILNDAVETGTLEALPGNLEETLAKLKQLGEGSNQKLSVLMGHSSSELNALAIQYDVSLTVDDIVGFNDLKGVLENMTGSVYLSKTDLLAFRLERELTEEEISGLTLLQDYYNQISSANAPYDLSTATFEELAAELDALPVPPSAETMASIEIGFYLLKSLME
jgi:hypothetical protein